MQTFLSIHQAVITGTLSTFDRLIFKGHLSGFYPEGAFARFLNSQHVLLKDFASYAETTSAELKAQAQRLAAEAKRPYLYLAAASTAASGHSKEAQARAIAERDGITEGLICVLAVVEPCRAFTVRGNRETQRREVVRENRKCLHFYFYYLDREFGFMHVRLQSWFPFTIQVYINGREWLARQLDQRGIAYQRYDNKLTQVADLSTAQALCEQFAHRRWPRVLDAFARQVNPLLPTIRRAGFRNYFWSVDQAEYATDVLFRDRASLEALLPALQELATTAFSAEDVLRFLGRKLHGNFQGEVTTSLKRRREGRRVKHAMKRNSLKLYDVLNVLRIETTFNNPREFRVLRLIETKRTRQWRWRPMGKGVANFWRYAQVGQQANARYLEALAHAQPKGKVIAELDGLCRSRREKGERVAKFNPVAAQDTALFTAVLAGEHQLNGFRNKDLQARLFSTSPSSDTEQRRRSARVTRCIAKLRGHGLIAKVKASRLYRVTERGFRLMTAALWCRNKEFPGFVLQMAAA
jgi:hypothetical protein